MTATPTPPARRHRLRNTAIAVACAVGLYALVAGLVAPPLVKKAIADNAREKLGRVVAIDELSFNPFTLKATVKGLRMMEPDGKTPFVSVDQLDADGSIMSVYRLAPVADQLTVSGLKVSLVRDAETHYNVSDILAKLAAMPPTPEKDKARFSVSNIRVSGARIDFDDKPKGAKHVVSDIDLAIPFVSNLPSHLKEYVKPTFAAKVNGAPLHLEGETLPFENSLRTHVALDLDAFDLKRYVEYSPAPLPLAIDSGKLDAKVTIRFTQSPGKDASVELAGTLALHDLKVTAPGEGGSAQVGRIDAVVASFDPIAGLAKIDSLKIAEASAARGPIRVPAAEAKDILVDLKKKRVEVASLASSGAAIDLARKADGSLEMPLVLAKAEPAKAEPESPWAVALAKLTLDGYRVTLHDAAVKPAATHHVEVAHLEAASLSTDEDAKGTMTGHLALDKSGSVDVNGTFVLAPFALEAKLDARHVDIVPARRYVDEFKTVALKSGFASAKGTLALRSQGKALEITYNGAASIDKLATVDTTIGEALLDWSSVNASGIALRYSDAAPLNLAIADIAVDKIYSRVVVNPDGKLNLQQLKAATPGEPDAPAPAPGDAKPRNVRIDRITFKDSRLNFTDHFIKPNYSADVGSLAGSVTHLSSDPAVHAVVDLKGHYNKTSPVTIAGSVNPLSGDLFLDIAANGKDIELPTLSAYSVRYAGYGITKGRLTLDVKYHIEHGKMEGRNKIFLDQLTFGEHVDSPEATKLPVLLAVNLLKNAKGEISLELPVSGSLDDPQFEIGALVGQVVANLLKKAITSPFSLLTAAFGGSGASGSGSDDLAYVSFDSGLARIDPAAEKKLDTVAKALADRPGIRIEMAGHNDGAKDLAALKKAALRAKLGAPDDAQYAARVKIEYLKENPPAAAKEPAGQDAKAKEGATKEGTAKDAAAKAPPKEPSLAEMEAFLLDRVTVGEEELRALAARRSESVKSYLISKGGLAPERVLMADASQPDTQKDEASRVTFALK